MKTCLKNLNAGAAFPGSREDFVSDEAWHHWRMTELSHLSQLMVVLVQFNPELAKSTPSEALPSVPTARPGSIYSFSDRTSPVPASRHGSVSSRHSVALVGGGGTSGTVVGPGYHESTLDLVSEQLEDDDEVEVGYNFTFIPPNPRRYYKRLLEICIQADLEAMATLPEDQEVSLGILSLRHIDLNNECALRRRLGILSPRHIDLINECALRWRIGHTYRVACFMDVIRYKYERGRSSFGMHSRRLADDLKGITRQRSRSLAQTRRSSFAFSLYCN